MGIPSYFSYILRNHKYILKELYTIKYQYLYIDSNSIIYENIDKEGNIYKNILDSIYIIIQKINPKKTFVCFDGVAPLAKLKQQKQRRYKSWLTKEILNRKSDFNSNCITPGTVFMQKLNEYLKQHLDKNIILNDSSSCGEGEYKIFDYIRKNNENVNHIVYGLDADLIMLGLLQYPKKIYLYRETKHFSYLKHIQEDKEYTLQLDVLGIQISKLLNHSDIKNSIENYCFLCFLCGNDFLPHNPSINIRNNGIDYLLDKYKKNVKYIIKDSQIKWKQLYILFNELSIYETQMIYKQIEWKKTKNIHNINAEDRLNSLPLMDVEHENYIYQFPNKYNEILFNQKNDDFICKNYLEMLEWTWKYYNGLSIDYNLFYKMNYAPKFESLKKHIPCFDEPLINETKIKYVHPITQLIFVLPYSDFNLIPKINIDELIKIFPELTEINFDIQYSFCHFFWESYIDFHYIDILKLEHYVREYLE